MAVLRTPNAAATYAQTPPVLDGVPDGVSKAARRHGRVRSGLAVLVYSTGYPLLAGALWTGARNGQWGRAGVLVMLAIVMSFAGWALLSATGGASGVQPAGESERKYEEIRTYLALYNRAGAIIVLLGSYAVAASSQGWPTPQTFIGWFALVWVPLFVSFAIPVERGIRSADMEE